METQPPDDHSALYRMMVRLQAEVAHLREALADVDHLREALAELTRSTMSPTIASVNNKCGYKTDMEAQMQQAVIDVPDITTVELRLPGAKSQFYHKCFMCKERFPSSFREPKQCPRCGTHRWQDGLTKWDRKKARPMN